MLLIIVIALSVLLFLSLIALAFFIYKTYSQSTIGLHKCSKHLVGKVVIVTGSNIGIGYETAKDLAERGARVIITSIDDSLGIAARDKIIKETGNKDVLYYFLDLTMFDSVRKFCDIILKTETRLDILVNNAGVYFSENIKTQDGILQGLQINYFGPFLLTNLLLPLLRTSAPSRIVNVASMLHHKKINLNDVKMEKVSFNSNSVYKTSKLYTIVTTIEMARRLHGTGITVNCLHPGVVNTGIIYGGKINKSLLNFTVLVLKQFIKSSWEGAQTSIYLAVSPNVDGISGQYFSDCRVKETKKKLHDEKTASELWELSENIVKLK